MGPGRRALVILCLGWVVWIVVLYAAARVSLLHSFSVLEEDDCRKDLERVRSEMEDTLNDLSATTNDYGAWDRMYEFMHDPPSPQLIADEFKDGTLQGLHINSVLVIDPAGRVVFAKDYDFLHHWENAFPPETQKMLAGDPWVLGVQSPSTRGLFLLPQGPVFLTACPIVTTDQKGPLRGVLLVSRNLDQAYLHGLQGTEHVSLALQPASSGQLPEDFREARSALTSGQSEWVEVLSADRVAIYSLLNDIHGRPILILRLDQERHVYRNGVAALRSFLAVLCVTSGLLGFAGWLVFRKKLPLLA